MALGSTHLGADNLDIYASQLSLWGSVLTQDADILLYGCNVASGEPGLRLMENLSLLTGADVAASEDATSPPSRGGDWDLEYASGTLETPSLFERWVVCDYGALLGAVNGTAVDDAITLETAAVTAGVEAVAVAVSFAPTAAVSLSIGVSLARNEIYNEVEAYIANADSVLARHGPVSLQAIENATIDATSWAVAVSAAVSQAGIALSEGGANATNMIANRVHAYIARSSVTTDLWDSHIIVAAQSTSSITATVWAASVAVGAGSGLGAAVAIGVTIAENHIGSETPYVNEVLAYIDNSTVTSACDIRVSASSQETIASKSVAASAAVAASPGFGLAGAGAGTGTWNLIGTTVQAYLRNTDATAVGDILVTAKSSSQVTKSTATGVAVALSLAPQGVAISVAASTVENTIGNSVQAYIAGTNAGTYVAAGGDIAIVADVSARVEEANAVTASVSAGLVGLSGGGIDISNTIENTVAAHIDGPLQVAADGDVKVAACENAYLTADATAISVSISLGAAAGVALVKNVIGSTIQAWIEDATVTSSNALVRADSIANIPTTATAGISGSAVGVQVNEGKATIKTLVKAYVENATLLSSGDITISATANNTAKASGWGGAFGAIAVGVQLASVNLGRGVGVDEVEAAIGAGTTVTARTLRIIAGSADTLGAQSTAGGGGAVAGAGAESRVTNDNATLARIEGGSSAAVSGWDSGTGQIAFATAHGLSTGDEVLYQNTGAGSADIGGLRHEKTYFVIYVDETHIRLAASAGDARAQRALRLTSAGSEVGHTLTRIATRVSVGPLAIESTHVQDMDSSADSYAFALASGSGAGVYNTITGGANVDICAGVAVHAGNIIVNAKNQLTKEAFKDSSNLRSGSASLGNVSVLKSDTDIGVAGSPFEAVVHVRDGAQLIVEGDNRNPGVFRMEAVTDIFAVDSVRIETVSGFGVSVGISRIASNTVAAINPERALLESRAGDIYLTARTESSINPSANLLAVAYTAAAAGADATGLFDDPSGLSLLEPPLAANSITIIADDDILIAGIVESLDDGSDVSISAGGLLLVAGLVAADDQLFLSGGADESGISVRLEEGGTLRTGVGGHITISGMLDVLLDGAVGLYLAPSNAADTWRVTILASLGDITVTGAVHARDRIGFEAAVGDINLLAGAVVRTRPRTADDRGDVYFKVLQGTVFIATGPDGSETAVVEGTDRIHVFADTIHIDGVVAYDQSPAGVVFNAVHDIVVTGLVYSLGVIELNAGVDPAWDESVLTGGNIPVAQLGPGNIYVYGTGQLHSETDVRLHAGGDVHVLAAAQDSDEQIQLLLPYVTQESVIIEVVTGSHQVEAGTILVLEVHWVPTIITEQVGYEFVQVGSYYHTMDVTLEEIGYYNPNPPTPTAILPLFPTVLAYNNTSQSAGLFTGAPNDSYFGLGNRAVRYDLGQYRIYNRAGGDFNVYEVDWGSPEFNLIRVYISEDGVSWADVTYTVGPALDIPGDFTHGDSQFARSCDIANSGLSSVRYIQIRGIGEDPYWFVDLFGDLYLKGNDIGFDLDAVGVFVVDPNLSADPLPEVMTYFVEGKDYFNAQIDWSGVGAPAAGAAFHDLNEAQRQRVLDTLGYRPLYDFAYANARRYETINGTPSVPYWEPDWADNTLAVYDASRWDSDTDGYVRMPAGAMDDVAEFMLQNTATAARDVASYTDSAIAYYTQDKSAYESIGRWYWDSALQQYKYEWTIDNDNSPARWSVSYGGAGQRQYIIAGDSGSVSVNVNRDPDWVASTNWLGGDGTDPSLRVYDILGRNVRAVSAYLATTGGLSHLDQPASYTVAVGSIPHDHYGAWSSDYWITESNGDYAGWNSRWTWSGWVRLDYWWSGYGSPRTLVEGCVDYGELSSWVYPGDQSGPLFQNNRSGYDIDWDSPNDYDYVDVAAWTSDSGFPLYLYTYYVKARGATGKRSRSIRPSAITASTGRPTT